MEAITMDAKSIRDNKVIYGSTPAGKGEFTISGADGDEISITAKGPDGKSLSIQSWLKDDTDLSAAGTNTTYSFKFSESTKGVYTVKGKIDNADAMGKINVSAEAAEPEPSGNGKVVETQWGEASPRFTGATGIVTAVAIGAILVGTVWMLSRLPKPSRQLHQDDQLVDGSFVEAIAAYVFVAVTGASVALLFAGAWMAALEVRGRLRTVSVTTDDDDAVGSRGLGDGVTAALEKLPEIIKQFSLARGTIAVLVTGAVLILAVCISAANVATATSEQSDVKVPPPVPTAPTQPGSSSTP